ncbi:hypothetical protein C2845_PM06G17450 [Panicum miliaceum]|uniref:Uncharacterized protein n=1 Tax=Panicum miliaceum TaxID=4540 RepID=A0A3L6R7Z3_PANMI|nr:hypothetical protein C2845_PM06G17450 [Panicum miliaceum]
MCAHLAQSSQPELYASPFAKKEKGKLETELVDSTAPRRHEPTLPRRYQPSTTANCSWQWQAPSPQLPAGPHLPPMPNRLGYCAPRRHGSCLPCRGRQKDTHLSLVRSSPSSLLFPHLQFSTARRGTANERRGEGALGAGPGAALRGRALPGRLLPRRRRDGRRRRRRRRREGRVRKRRRVGTRSPRPSVPRRGGGGRRRRRRREGGIGRLARPRPPQRRGWRGRARRLEDGRSRRRPRRRGALLVLIARADGVSRSRFEGCSFFFWCGEVWLVARAE